MSRRSKASADTLFRPNLRGDGLRALLQSLRIHSALTRAEMGHLLKVSPATISHWVQELLDQGWIQENDTRAWTAGRPSTRLTLHPDAAHALVIDVTHDGIAVALVNFLGEVVDSETIDHPMEDFASGVSLLHNTVHRWVERTAGRGISGISIVFPGIWDHDKRHLLFSSSLSSWIGMDIPTHSWGIPVVVDNDANSAALGEVWFGGQPELSDALVILMRWGVGSAMVHHRQILGGDGAVASGLGHMIVQIDGDAPLCACGNRGCLEAVVGPAMRRLNEGARFGLGALRTDGTAQTPVTSQTPVTATHSSVTCTAPPVTESELKHVAEVLGAGTANLVNLLGVKEIVVVSDQVVHAPNLWAMWVQEVRGLIMPHLLHKVRFQSSRLGEKSVILGGAWQVFSRALETLEKKEAL